MICRDRDGRYMGSSLVVYEGITDPTLLETLACQEAMALAEDLGVQKIHVASDCEGVVKDIRQELGGLHGAIIKEVNARTDTFISYNFIHECGMLNFEAHNLAKFSCSIGIGRHVWLVASHDKNFVPMNIVTKQ